MEFRPFGLDDRGEKICDITGVVVQSNVDYMCDYLTHTAGPEAAQQAMDRLCRLLNDRLPDRNYHVTPIFFEIPGIATPMNLSVTFVSFANSSPAILNFTSMWERKKKSRLSSKSWLDRFPRNSSTKCGPISAVNMSAACWNLRSAGSPRARRFCG